MMQDKQVFTCFYFHTLDMRELENEKSMKNFIFKNIQYYNEVFGIIKVIEHKIKK